jgi:hypothetical protein
LKNLTPFFFLLFCAKAIAQNIAIEATLHCGAVWRHTPKLTTRTGETLFGQEIGLRFQTTGRRDWQAWQRYPIFGISFAHFRLGEGSHGDGLGLLPHLSLPIIRSGKFAAFFRLGTGLAWVTRPYDYFENQGENAIGSHWNNVTQFRLGGEWRLDGRLRLNAGMSLTHFSNGGSALPNYGINIPSGYAGLVWSPKPILEEKFLPAQSSKRATKSFGGLLQTGLAMLEYGVYDGPKYPLWAGAVAGYFHFNQVNRVHLGVDYEFNKAVYEYGLHIAEFENEEEARKGATRLAIFVADEFLFGNLGVQLQLGRYVGKNLNHLTAKSNYSKLTLRVYFPKLFQTTLQPHFGITLKAHATTAEYISANAGLAF